MTWWLQAVVTVGAIARLTRLVTGDQLLQDFRDWAKRTYVAAWRRERGIRYRVARRFDWAYLVTCPWCTSIWIGVPGGIIATYWIDNRVCFGIALGLTASYIAGNVQSREPDSEDPSE